MVHLHNCDETARHTDSKRMKHVIYIGPCLKQP
jgi:hypothetical protein